MRDAIRDLARPDAAAVLTRFPFAALAALMLGGRALLPDGLNVDWDDPATAWTFGWTVVLMSSVAIAIWAESRGVKNGLAYQALSLLLGLGAGLAWETTFVSPLWTIVALFALMLVSPAPGRDEQALWSYDARASTLFAFAVVAATTLALGLIAILEATEYLFDVEFGDKSSLRIFSVCFWFVLPVYWLALLPGRDADVLQPGDLLFKAVATLGALLAVVIGALAALLHAYAAKIVVDGAMPKGQVGWIVSVALSVGLFAWLLAAADCGPALALRRAFRRWWFPLTLVPTALLIFAIRERVAAYGVTADRYALGAAGMVSVGFLALWLARRAPPTIRSVLIVAFAVSLLAAVGPVNMPNAVASSQIARLKARLSTEGLLDGGRVTSEIAKARWSNDKAAELASIVGVLSDVSALNRLDEIIPPEKAASRADAQQFLGAEFRGSAPPDTTSVHFSRAGGFVALDGGAMIGPFQVWRSIDGDAAPFGTPKFDGVELVLEETRLKVVRPGRETVFDLAPLAEATAATEGKPFSLKSSDGRSAMSVTNATFYRRAAEGFQMQSIGGVAFLADE